MTTSYFTRCVPAAVTAAMLFAGFGCSKIPMEQSVNASSPAPAAVASMPGPSRPSPISPPVPKELTIPEGTRLRVRTVSALSTRNASTGDAFQATLAEPLVIGGHTLAPRGARLCGTVAESNPGGRIKGVARIAIRLSDLQLAGGHKLEMRTDVLTYHARRTRKRDAMTIGAGSGVGAAVGAIAGGGLGAAIGAGVGGGAGAAGVLVTRGAPAVIPAESLLTFTLRDPVKIRL